jgi:hypothetical protein
MSRGIRLLPWPQCRAPAQSSASEAKARVNSLRPIRSALAWLRAAAANLLLLAQYKGRRSMSRLHLERLASDIVDVASSIEADLGELPSDAQILALAARAVKCRRQAETASAARHASAKGLADAVGQLHEGHWRIVNLRSELDARIAAQRSGKEPVRPCRFATGSKPVRSRWSSTGSHTRPTVFE